MITSEYGKKGFGLIKKHFIMLANFKTNTNKKFFHQSPSFVKKTGNLDPNCKSF